MIVFQFFGTVFTSYQLNTKNEHHPQVRSTVHPQNEYEWTSYCQQDASPTQDSGLRPASMNNNVGTASGTEETFCLNMHGSGTLQHENDTHGNEKKDNINHKKKKTTKRSFVDEESNLVSYNPLSPANTFSEAHGHNSPLGIYHEKNDPHREQFGQFLDSWISRVAANIGSRASDYHDPHSEQVLSPVSTIRSRDMSDESHNSSRATLDSPSDTLSHESGWSFGLFTAPFSISSPANPPSNRFYDDQSDTPEHSSCLDCPTPDPSNFSVFDVFSPSNPNCGGSTPFNQSDDAYNMDQHLSTVRKGTMSRQMTASQTHESSKRQTPLENQRITSTLDQYHNTNNNPYPSTSELVTCDANTRQISSPTIFTNLEATDTQCSHLTSHESPVLTYTEHPAVPVATSSTHVEEPLNYHQDGVQNPLMSGVYSESTTEQYNPANQVHSGEQSVLDSSNLSSYNNFNQEYQVHSGEQSVLDSFNLSSYNNFNQEYQPQIAQLNPDNSHTTYFDEESCLDQITLQPLTPVVYSQDQLFGENSGYQEQMNASSYHQLFALVESSVVSPITSEIPVQDQSIESSANSISQHVTLEPQEFNDEQALILKFKDLMKQCELVFESRALKYFGTCYTDYANASESECSDDDDEYDNDDLSD